LLEIPNILRLSLTSLLKNIPTRNFHSSQCLQHSQFRWLTYQLLASNHVSQLEVWKAYTKNINPELCRMIHIYLATERVPHIKGEPYTVEQVREAAEYIFEGSDPCFEIVGQVPRLKNSTKAPQLFSTTDKAAKQQWADSHFKTCLHWLRKK